MSAWLPIELPLDETPLGRVLVWLLSVLLFAAITAAAVALAAENRLRELRLEPTVITIALPPATDRAQAERRTREVLRLLDDQPGLSWARPLSGEELNALVEPWMSAPASGDDLVLPQLIDLAFDADAAPDLSALAAALQDVVPGTTIGETGALKETRRDIEIFVRAAAVVVCAAMLLLAALASGALTRIQLRLHDDEIDLLRQMGARDARILRQFRRHALDKVLKAAFVATTLAIGLLAAGVVARTWWPPMAAALPGPSPLDWAALALVPVLGVVLVVLAVQIAAGQGLHHSAR
ncbi:MAG: hypothetical protein KDE35_10775 [Geminicoccaceae bacterium]|nr:hypothetical protein [Geminicoccaceae bacterium]